MLSGTKVSNEWTSLFLFSALCSRFQRVAIEGLAVTLTLSYMWLRPAKCYIFYFHCLDTDHLHSGCLDLLVKSLGKLGNCLAVGQISDI